MKSRTRSRPCCSRNSQLQATRPLVDGTSPVELWRKGKPDKTIGRMIAAGLAAALGAASLRFVDLGATDLYEAVTGARAHADRVVECVDDAHVHELDVRDAVLEQAASQVTLEPGELKLVPGEETVTSGDVALSDATVQPGSIDAHAEVHAPRVVSGQASADLRFEATARGQTRTIGTAEEHDEALPITPRRGSSFSSGFDEPLHGGDDIGETVTGNDVATTADDDVATAEGIALPTDHRDHE